MRKAVIDTHGKKYMMRVERTKYDTILFNKFDVYYGNNKMKLKNIADNILKEWGADYKSDFVWHYTILDMFGNTHYSKFHP